MLVKALITQVDNPANSVPFQFNPETLSYTQRTEWRKRPNQSATDAPVKQYGGPKGTNLKLTMLLDNTMVGSPPVLERIGLLSRWLSRGDAEQPPLLRFLWGKLRIGGRPDFVCHLESLDVDFSLFSADGLPMRAKCTVNLNAAAPEVKGQNPTSGGREPLRSETLHEGDSLALLSHRTYGSTKQWRAIADHNQIDNPFRRANGSDIVLPAKRVDGRRG